MKSRKQIEESFKDIAAPAGTADLYRAVMEILLDIRELLMEEKRARMEQKIRRMRELAERKRKENRFTRRVLSPEAGKVCISRSF